MTRSARAGKTVAAVVLACVGVVALLFVRAVLMPSKQLVVQVATPAAIDAAAAAAHLAGALRFATVSADEARGTDVAQLEALRAYLTETYPGVHARLQQEVVGEHSLLYTWQGSDASLAPMLLAAHMDVVPAEASAEASWTHPPFAGTVADGFVWGRGAIDDKLCVIGILEAVEHLLAEGFRPTRTVYLAFGHDEEIGGAHGAAAIAELLRTRNVKLDSVLDEGLPITVGIIPGVTPPVALIGIAEKGYTTVALTVTSAGGHSSTPPRQTAIGIASAAVRALEQQPFPARFGGVADDMFAYLAPEMGFAQRIVFANHWLFGPVIEHVLGQSPETDALIRTTTAATVIEGGVKDNVLPRAARVLVNFRSLPGDDPEDIVEHVRTVVADERVQVELDGGAWGSDKPSPLDSPQFERLKRTVREVYANTLVAPGLVLGATDARKYADLSANVYRFTPVPMESGDVARVHGVDERVGVENFAQSVRFYYRLIRNVD